MIYKILTASSPEELTAGVNRLIQEGWTPVGSHTATEEHRQNRYAGQQHMDTLVRVCYAQTLIKENPLT